MPSEPKRKLAAIMFTDMVGYTALMQDKEAKARELIQRHRELMKPLVEKHGGKILQYVGDGTFITFDSAIEAVNSAFEIQKELKFDPDVNLRIGIHVGDVVVEGDEVYGDGVNVASRLEPLAEPGGVCISERVYDDIRNQEDIEAEFVGEKLLKNVEHPIKVYALVGAGLPKVSKDLRTRLKVYPIFHFLKQKRLVLPVIIGVGILIFASVRLVKQSQLRSWARLDAIPEIYRLEELREFKEAYNLAEQVEKIIPSDSMLARILPGISQLLNIDSDPQGANVYRKEYGDTAGEWILIGQTPIEKIRVPREIRQLKLEKKGFSDAIAVTVWWKMDASHFKLSKKQDVPAGMVRVQGGEFTLNLPGLDYLESVEMGDFLIDKYEVTNNQFKEFVEQGGYLKKEFWKYSFIKGGKTLSWEQAMADFVDKTGQPGPSTWEVSDYADGEGNYPVTGISWYEAEAYAEFVGRELPTIYHWSRAAGTTLSSIIIPLSNLEGSGPSAVGSYAGVSPFGSYDMAGNAREWCMNKNNEGDRFILGGGWNDAEYSFNDAYTQDPMDRSKTNGFRCIKQIEKDDNYASFQYPVNRLFRDFYKEKPVSDDVFNIYMGMYAYDPTDLNAEILSIDDQSEDWVREKITFNAAYAGERVIAYLFLPKNVDPPYQTVVYFPGSNAIHSRSSESLANSLIKFIVKSGRAVIYPIYKSTFERGDELNSDYANETKFYRDHVIMWAQDLSRSIDYLATRPDIDSDRIAYYGVSWGAAMGAIMCAVENRFKASILFVAGLGFEHALPEVDPINFISRVTVPVLMMNGEYDFYFPVETSQKPFFEFLGTPPEDKKQIIYPTGHSVPRSELIKESLAWLDRYLGSVRKHDIALSHKRRL